MRKMHTVAEVMTRLKTEYGGTYDLGVAFSVVKTVLDGGADQSP
jgi:hypothetical protein